MALSDLMMFDGNAPLKAFEMGRESGLSRLAQQNKMKVGQVLAQGDYKSGAKAAYGVGELETGSALARLAMQEEQQIAEQKQAQQKQAQQQQLAGAVAGVLPPHLAALAGMDPRLAIQMYGSEQQNNVRAQQLADSQKPKAPAGYAFVGDNELQPLKGGPADPTVKNAKNSRLAPMPAELASRIGLAKNFMQKYGQLVKDVEGGGLGDVQGVDDLNVDNLTKRFNLAAGRGEQGRIWRELKGGSEALTRMLTGAGMNMAEAKSEVQQYLPSNLDTKETILSKMGMLNERLNAMVIEASAGRISSGIPTGQEPPSEGYQGADGITDQDIGGLGDGGAEYPSDAIELLASDPSPEAMREFDEAFGQGASRRVLGQ